MSFISALCPVVLTNVEQDALSFVLQVLKLIIIFNFFFLRHDFEYNYLTIINYLFSSKPMKKNPLFT